MKSNPVLLYDGECGLCQRLVRMLLKADERGRLRYAPLQGASAQAFLAAQGLPTEDFDSLVLVPEWPEVAGTPGVPYLLRTDGALGALRVLGGVGRVMAWARVLPRAWRDAAYRVVARTRQRWFGSAMAWGQLSPEQQARFLDGP